MNRTTIFKIITIFIINICLYYSYSPFALPFREKKIEIYNEDKVYSLNEIAKNSNKYEKSTYDYSAQLREENIKVKGYFTIDTIEETSNQYKITGEEQISDYRYLLFSRYPKDVGDSSFINQYRIVVLYINKNQIEDESVLYQGAKIRFIADFNKINHNYLIINNGEIELC